MCASPDRVTAGTLVVLPARLASTRLPGKMLLAETGKPLIVHTYEAACRARLPRRVIVACDDAAIAEAVEAGGGEAMLTDPAAASGTDRVAEVARRLPEYDTIVNLQGDEPEIEPAAIDRLIELLAADSAAAMATLATPIRNRPQLEDPACVKVVTDAHGRALYFSRSVIPHARTWNDELLQGDPPVFLQHVGMYAYRRDFLLRFAEYPVAPLEQVECLEQLRALYHGHVIVVGVIDSPSIGIDTPEDYRRFVQRYRAGSAGRP